MIDTLKDVGDLIKQLPELSIWIFCGILLYKVIIVGSWFAIAKLLIVKLHSVFNTKSKTREYMLNGLLCNVSEDRLKRVLKNIPHTHGYLFTDNINWLEDAIAEKRDRDRDK